MKKTALLIGINDYDVDRCKLTSAVKDAEDMEQKLSQLGFSCSCHIDIDFAALNRIKAEFERSLKNNEVGLFYFAGHGFEIESVNYLAMTDAPLLDDDVAIKHCCLCLNDILTMLENSSLKVKIVILDACRSSSVGGRGEKPRGFAPILAPKGTIIAFATSPGQVAKEALSGNGVYTSALLDCIDYPALNIENMFKRVREIVSVNTKGMQISWEHTSLIGDFSFNPGVIDGSYMGLYSDEALADEFYMPNSDSVLAGIIQDLRTHDYNYQNPAIGKVISTLRANVEHLVTDDLFVLGRNLYQTGCGASFAGQRFMQSLEYSLRSMDDEVSYHVLNGISYEIYFDSHGKLRKNFKSDYYDVVLRLLETDYDKSLNFIKSQLQPFDNQVLYLPGSAQNYILNIILDAHDTGWRDTDAYVINQIYCKGQPILYDEDSNALWDNTTEPLATYYPQKEVENKIIAALAVPRNRARLVYSNTPTEFDESNDNDLVFPVRFSLRWYE